MFHVFLSPLYYVGIQDMNSLHDNKSKALSYINDSQQSSIPDTLDVSHLKATVEPCGIKWPRRPAPKKVDTISGIITNHSDARFTHVLMFTEKNARCIRKSIAT